jgi:hypothetical protein
MPKAIWNKLPALEKDVERIYALTPTDAPIKQRDLFLRSKLSRTRFLCSLDALIASRRVEERPKGFFRRC